MMRMMPCCICPARYEDFKNGICKNCDFVKKYIDKRGWIFFVRDGLGDSNYKTFFKKPDRMGSHGYTGSKWHKTFTEAQKELNEIALKKKWQEI